MSKPHKDPPKRKSVTMLASMWQDIADIQAQERITTEAEAHRRVVQAGVKVLREKERG